MWATVSRRTVLLALLFTLLIAPVIRSQDVPIPPLVGAPYRSPLAFSMENCNPRFSRARFFRFGLADQDVGPLSSSFADYLDAPSYINSSCGISSAPANPLLKSGAANPCASASSLAADPRDGRCADSSGSTAPAWASLGKSGVEVRRAREEVMDILRTPNACREWFAGKDPEVDRTFESLGFLIDHQGQEDVVALLLRDSTTIIRQPYVASATQDGGAYTHITVNAHGAFYRAQAKLQKLNPEGGPNQFSGEHWLTVGPYGGNSLEAQTLTLLHELGHIVDLLPEDSDDLDGKSARNTSEVLRHCRAEIEASAKHARETAKK